MTRSRWVDVLLLVLVLGLAWLLYRPDRPLPLDLWDFREFLPILERHPGVWNGYGALLDYYASHGRMNPLFYFTFAVQYALFGEGAHGWQLVRFAMMSAAVIAAYALARRLAIAPVGAALAAALLVTATPVSRAWLQLMAEPICLLALLLALHAALGYRDRAQWRGPALLMLGMIAVVFLSKEVVGVLGAVVVVLAACGWPGPLARPRLRDPRVAVLGVGALLIAGAVAVMLLVVRDRPEATGYGMSYGAGALTVGRLVHNIGAIATPISPGRDTLLGLLYPANVLALLLAGLGFATALRRGKRRVAVESMLVTGLVVLAGALVYWPWPKFDAFYALPFFLAPSLLLGAAATALWQEGGTRRILVAVAVVAIAIYAAIPAHRSAVTANAALHLNHSVTRIIGALPAIDTVVVLGPVDGPRRLPVAAAELRDFAVVLADRAPDDLPTVVDRACAAVVPPAAAGSGLAQVTWSYGCGRLPQADLSLSSPFAWRDWLTFEAVHDTLWVDLVGEPARVWVRGRQGR